MSCNRTPASLYQTLFVDLSVSTIGTNELQHLCCLKRRLIFAVLSVSTIGTNELQHLARHPQIWRQFHLSVSTIGTNELQLKKPCGLHGFGKQLSVSTIGTNELQPPYTLTQVKTCYHFQFPQSERMSCNRAPIPLRRAAVPRLSVSTIGTNELQRILRERKTSSR